MFFAKELSGHALEGTLFPFKCTRLTLGLLRWCGLFLVWELFVLHMRDIRNTNYSWPLSLLGKHPFPTPDRRICHLFRIRMPNPLGIGIDTVPKLGMHFELVNGSSSHTTKNNTPFFYKECQSHHAVSANTSFITHIRLRCAEES